MLLDGEGKVVQVNRTLERLLALPWSELVGKDIPSLLGDAGGAGADALRADARVGELARPGKWHLGEFWLRVSVDPIRDADHVIKGALCLVSDITSQKRLEMQLLGQARRLQEDDRRKDEFLAMLAPRAPQPPGPPLPCAGDHRLAGRRRRAGREALEIARRQVQHMARLVDDLLDVSRITRGKIELRKQVVDFNAIVAHAIETTRPLMESRRHEFSTTLWPEPMWLEGDPDAPGADRRQPAE